MNTFVICSACSRHVRAQDVACPFCLTPNASTTSRAANAPAVPTPRMGRIAVLAAGVALAAGAAACDGTPIATDGGAGAGGGGGGGTAGHDAGQDALGTGGGGGGAGGAKGSGGSGGASTDGGITLSDAAIPDAARDAPIAIYAAAIALPNKP